MRETTVEQTFYFEGGITGFVRHLNRNRVVRHPLPIYITKSIDTTIIEVALQYNDGFSESIFSFANCVNTIDGGTHLTGFRSALTRVLNDYAHKNKFLKEDDPNLTGDDVREGLTAVVSVKLAEPQFEGQTKGKLGNIEIKSQVESAVNEGLALYLEEHPDDAKKIIDKCVTVRPGPGGRPQGARPDHPEERPGYRHAARQAGRLLGERPGAVRAVPGGGRLRRRLGQAGAEPPLPGDIAPARQNPERGKSPAGQDAGQRRNPHHHHRPRRRHRRRFRPGRDCAITASS